MWAKCPAISCYWLVNDSATDVRTHQDLFDTETQSHRHIDEKAYVAKTSSNQLLLMILLHTYVCAHQDLFASYLAVLYVLFICRFSFAELMKEQIPTTRKAIEDLSRSEMTVSLRSGQSYQSVSSQYPLHPSWQRYVILSTFSSSPCLHILMRSNSG